MNIISKIGMSIISNIGWVYDRMIENRKKAKFSVKYQEIHELLERKKPCKKYLKIKVINKCRKTLHLKKFLIKLKSEENYDAIWEIPVTNKYKGEDQKTLPIDLKPGDAISNFWDYSDFISSLKEMETKGRICRDEKIDFCVEDAEEKQYCAESDSIVCRIIKSEKKL